MVIHMFCGPQRQFVIIACVLDSLYPRFGKIGLLKAKTHNVWWLVSIQKKSRFQKCIQVAFPTA